MLHLERQRSGSEISPAFLVSATHGGWLSGKSLTHPRIIKISPYLDKISSGSKILYFMGLVLSCKIIIIKVLNEKKGPEQELQNTLGTLYKTM